jgi:hypothetical protein
MLRHRLPGWSVARTCAPWTTVATEQTKAATGHITGPCVAQATHADPQSAAWVALVPFVTRTPLANKQLQSYQRPARPVVDGLNGLTISSRSDKLATHSAKGSVVAMSQLGLVSRVTPVHTAQRNCTRDGGWPFEFGNQVSISSHRKLLSSKATVVNVAETSGHDPAGMVERGERKRTAAEASK